MEVVWQEIIFDEQYTDDTNLRRVRVNSLPQFKSQHHGPNRKHENLGKRVRANCLAANRTGKGVTTNFSRLTRLSRLAQISVVSEQTTF